ncbi:GGDEF domain-containing protein [Marinicella rhabdoformis]|uniref:GGDEF domain-containing protein n=1 Tax=Marinicella rhabdoformis TaxID=2580566 RepID=UPI0012AECA64|nr:GGDEF domain-containing protein [Marinicella rhabdoformis]
MYNFLQLLFPFKTTQLVSHAFDEKFEEWDKPSRQIQISAIAFLTAILYMLFSMLNKSWATENLQNLMLKVHLFVVVPMLLVISFLAFRRKYYNTVMNILAVSPIISIICHAYIISKLPYQAPYQMEGYMIIFWTFVISGLTFKHALISASCSAIILLTTAYFYINQPDYYTMHVFWVFCSFSFGFLGALIFDQSRKAVYSSHQELHQIAITDNLTGVFNRNQLNQVLKAQIDKCTKESHSFGLIILDIDHFKAVNDTFGHDIGDKVLQQTAQLLSELTQNDDILFRWGGEEFIIVALDVNKQSLIQYCDVVRKQFEQESFGTTESMTVSIGATLLQPEDTQDKLISRADKALYKAKENGRNNCVYI